MGLGQTMLTAGFLVLLTVLIIGANQLLIDSAQSKLYSQAVDIGADLAHSLMMEISEKKFDQRVTYAYYQNNYTDFTAPSSLGPESGESFVLPDMTPYKSAARYNDVDDYNGYTRVADGATITGFWLTAKVYYVTSSNMRVASSSSQYYKRVDVTVTHSVYVAPDTLKFSRVFKY